MNPFDGYARSEAVAFSIGNTGYVGTGYNMDDDVALSDFFAYDADMNNWTQIAAMPDSAARYSAVAFTIGKKGYVGLGTNVQNKKFSDFWVYDSESNTWNVLTTINEGPSRRYGAVAFTIDNLGYVGTGSNGSYLKDMWSYSPTTNSWTEITGYHDKVMDAVAFVIDGKGYVTTGTNGSYSYKLCVYDPATGTWEDLHNIRNEDDVDYDNDYAIRRSKAVAFSVGSRGYVALGDYNGAKNDVWEYNPRTDRWVEKTSCEGNARKDAVAFSLENGRAFIATGLSSSTNFDDIWEFEPMEDYNSDENE
jgi:N-acetylneuraminic acid mutarotase